ncbi:MAG: type II secretion system protein [Planctomycetaceae bacterium]
MRCFGSRRPSQRSGFTLIEAVVGTVLIGVFASTTLLAFRVHNTQLQNATDTLQAVRFADEKLDDLLQGKGPVRPAVGTVPGQADWQWSVELLNRTVPLANARAEVSRLRVVRVTDKRVLVSTDFVSHVEPPKSGGASR